MKKFIVVLYYIGLVVLILGVGCAVTSLVLSFFNLAGVSDILGIIAAICGPIAIVILILRLILIINYVPAQRRAPMPPKREQKIVTVDVKDIPKTREQELYEQYENLYKQNLITKEDLDKKRIELLGK